MTPKERFDKNVKIVYWVVRRLPKQLKYEEKDLIQEGKLALWNCCIRYDESKGKFFSYACIGIRNEIIKYIFKRRFLIRPPGVKWNNFYDVKRKLILMPDIQTEDERYEVENDLEKIYEMTDLIESEMVKEKDKFKKMIKLRIEGFTFRDIAKIYGVTHQCVSDYFNRNMKVFREKLIKKME